MHTPDFTRRFVRYAHYTLGKAGDASVIKQNNLQDGLLLNVRSQNYTGEKMSKYNCFIDGIRPTLEVLYFFSAMILAIAAIIGLQQLSLLKRDMNFRAKRAAKESALDAAIAFSANFIPQSNAFYRDCKEIGLQGFYDGPIGDFSFTSIPKEQLPITISRAKIASLNILGTICSRFITGVADEQTGFDLIGKDYCECVENYYDLIAIMRISDDTKGDDLTDLYTIWNNRLKKQRLENESKIMSEEYKAQAEEVKKALSELSNCPNNLPKLKP